MEEFDNHGKLKRVTVQKMSLMEEWGMLWP